MIITEDTVRQALRLDDANSINCLPNEEIFAELARMWVGKGFSGVDTSLFDGMLVPQQVHDDVATGAEDEVESNPPPSPHQSTIAQPSSPTPQQPSQPEAISHSDMALFNQLLETCATLTKKVGTLEQDKIAQAIKITKVKQRVRRLEKKRKLKALGLKRLKKVGTSQRVESSADTIMDDQDDASKRGGGGIAKLDADKDVTLEEVDAEKDTEVHGRLPESQAHVYHLDLEHAQKVLSMQETDEAELAEVEDVLEVVTTAKLMTKLVTTATTPITVAPVPKASALRRRRGVIIQDPKGATTTSLSVKSEVNSKDKGKGILVEEHKPLKRQAQIKQDEAFARELEVKLNANINWNEVIEQKGEKEREEENGKRKSESSKQKAAKKQKIDKEIVELKTHLQIVPNDEDDVYTEATPLDLKVPVVDYQIHTKHNKPYYKIIRADGTHQLFLSFISLLRNFDREEFEMMWKFVQERFESLEPKNFSDDFLLNALKTMFESLMLKLTYGKIKEADMD
uniref:Uncharacterized protein n=1 Tax=Tanacetum cinerariifolium TaxID=118510 RepID=A0A699J723_TANCI|nr:hypothetical protein [Tanacetum cinerariifolium]